MIQIAGGQFCSKPKEKREFYQRFRQGRNFRNIHYLNSRNSLFTGCKQDFAMNIGIE
ncbi:hypothetical protein PM8797T_19934 [Gimesia maris DSM 8797]|nr:hypothetical protein PM8797T_19934 [Gimesia maris DSM 8797]